MPNTPTTMPTAVERAIQDLQSSPPRTPDSVDRIQLVQWCRGALAAQVIVENAMQVLCDVLPARPLRLTVHDAALEVVQELKRTNIHATELQARVRAMAEIEQLKLVPPYVTGLREELQASEKRVQDLVAEVERQGAARVADVGRLQDKLEAANARLEGADRQQAETRHVLQGALAYIDPARSTAQLARELAAMNDRNVEGWRAERDKNLDAMSERTPREPVPIVRTVEVPARLHKSNVDTHPWLQQLVASVHNRLFGGDARTQSLDGAAKLMGEIEQRFVWTQGHKIPRPVATPPPVEIDIVATGGEPGHLRIMFDAFRDDPLFIDVRYSAAEHLANALHAAVAYAVAPKGIKLGLRPGEEED